MERFRPSTPPEETVGIANSRLLDVSSKLVTFFTKNGGVATLSPLAAS